MLLGWVAVAIKRLAETDGARDVTTDRGQWQQDTDGVFRVAERVTEMWDRATAPTCCSP
jgi:hypothetical protein